MCEDIECDKLFTVKLSVKHYDDGVMEEKVQEKLFWTAGEQTNIGWCAGVHIAAAIARLFPGAHEASERRDCFSAIEDRLASDTHAGDYKHLKDEDEE